MKLNTSMLLLVALVAVAGCKKSGSSSSNSPLNPGGSPLPGIWTGTVVRPGGQAPLSVSWDSGLNSYTMSGTLTLTRGNVSATTSGQGSVAGNDSSGYTIYMSFQSNGSGCTVRGNTEGGGAGDPFPQPYKTITVPAFSISYVACQELLGTNNPFVQETVQLNLTKP